MGGEELVSVQDGECGIQVFGVQDSECGIRSLVSRMVSVELGLWCQDVREED
jgi:hypothetical protein